MKKLILAKSIAKLIPMVIIGICNTACYGTEQILDPMAQLTPTEKDNKLAAKIKSKAAWLRGWGEKANKKLRNLGL